MRHRRATRPSHSVPMGQQWPYAFQYLWAVVTGLYPRAPFLRTPLEVVAALLPEPAPWSPWPARSLRARPSAPPWRGKRSPGASGPSGASGAKGPPDAVITAWEAAATHPRCTAPPRQAVRRTLGDDPRHRPSRRDDAYLARDWPIGTGVIAGAGGHLVQDSLEPSGKRWATAGAQVGLELQAVRLHGHGHRSGPCHRPPQRLYDTSAALPERAEDQDREGAACSIRPPQILVTLKLYKGQGLLILGS